MQNPAAADIIVQQRFQGLERELHLARAKVKATEEKLAQEKKVTKDVNQKNNRLASALSSVQAEKMKLEAELRRVLQQRQDFHSTGTILSSEFSLQLADLDKKLDEALSAKASTAHEVQELQSQLHTANSHLESRTEEVRSLEQELRRMEDQKLMIQTKVGNLEAKEIHQAKELELKLEQWLQNENTLKLRLQELIADRDELHIELEKKTVEFEKLAATLKDSTQALGNCLSIIKKTPELMDNLAADSDEVFSMLELPNSLSPHEEHSERQTESIRTSFESPVAVDEISVEELRSKHSSLVNRYNREIQQGLLLENDCETQSHFKRKALAENSSLRLQLSESKKITIKQQDEVESLENKVNQLCHTIEEKEAESMNLSISLEAVQKTCDDFAAQVKFLLTRMEQMKEMMDLPKTGSKRPRLSPLRGGRSSDNPSDSIHEIVEENKRLKDTSYRHQAEKGRLLEELERMKRTGGELAGRESAGERSQDEGESSKRMKRLASSPAHRAEDDGEEIVSWKEKWEAAEMELSSLRAAHLELEVHLNQVLETSSTGEMRNQEEIRRLEQGLVEYRSKYDALLEAYKTQGELYLSDAKAKGDKLKQMEALIRAMTSEMDSQKVENEELKNSLKSSLQEYENEKKAFAELQDRMISTEAEHLEEIKKLKDSMDSQISANFHLMSSTSSGLVDQKEVEETRQDYIQEVKDLVEQVKDKDRVIMELERRLQLVVEPIRNDRVHELESKVQLLNATLRSEQQQNEILQKSLSRFQEQCKTEMKCLNEENKTLLKEKDSKISELQIEDENKQIQITQLESANGELHKKLNSALEEQTAMKLSVQEQGSNLQMEIDSSKIEKENLNKELSTKTTELQTKMEVISSLRQSQNLSQNQIRQLEKEKEELNTKIMEQEKKISSLIANALPEVEVSIPVPESSSQEQLTDDKEKTVEEPNPASVVTTEEGDKAKEENQSQPVEVSQKRDLSSLLEMAKTKFISATSDQSKASTSTPESRPEVVSTGTGEEAHAASVDEEEKTGEVNKQPKWRPIVWKSDKKTEESGDDKKKERPSKH